MASKKAKKEPTTSQRLFKVYTDFDKGKMTKKQFVEKIENVRRVLSEQN